MSRIFWDCGGRRLDVTQPLLMGILNVTPDSFSDGGLYRDTKDAVDHALEMASDGATIIDIGGESTRPGYTLIEAAEEWDRVGPVLDGLARRNLILSIDTSKPVVMQKALHTGVHILNDVRAFEAPGAIEVARQSNAGLVVMHSRADKAKEGVTKRVREYLKERLALLQREGVALSRVVIDPGFGFAKTQEENLQLLKELKTLTDIAPILVGLSRKRMIGAISGAQNPRDRIEGSVAAALEAARLGAKILRVHDVKETRRGLICSGFLRVI